MSTALPHDPASAAQASTHEGVPHPSATLPPDEDSSYVEPRAGEVPGEGAAPVATPLSHKPASPAEMERGIPHGGTLTAQLPKLTSAPLVKPAPAPPAAGGAGDAHAVAPHGAVRGDEAGGGTPQNPVAGLVSLVAGALGVAPVAGFDTRWRSPVGTLPPPGEGAETTGGGDEGSGVGGEGEVGRRGEGGVGEGGEGKGGDGDGGAWKGRKGGEEAALSSGGGDAALESAMLTM